MPKSASSAPARPTTTLANYFPVLSWLPSYLSRLADERAGGQTSPAGARGLAEWTPALAAILSVVATVLTPVATTTDTSCHDRRRAGYRGGSCNWSSTQDAPSAHAAST